MSRRLMMIGAAALASDASAPAQAPAGLTYSQAEAIAEGCRDHSTGKRQSHAIAVVDGGGHLIAAIRMDGNRAGIMDFAIEKAKAVAAWGFATAQMEEAAKATPASLGRRAW